MRALDYITTAQTNLLRTKTRTILTVLAFVIGTFTLSMVTAFSQGLRSYLDSQLHAYGQANIINVRVGTAATKTSASGVAYYDPNRQASVSGGRESKVNYTLNQHDLDVVKSTPNIAAAYPDYNGLTINFIQLGNSQRYVLPVQSAVPGESNPLAAGQFPTDNQAAGIVLPFSYVEAFGQSDATQLVGKTVTVQVPNSMNSQTQDYTATITGILPDTAHQPAAYVSYQLLSNMVNYQSGSNTQFPGIIAVTRTNASKADRDQIRATLDAKDYNVQTYDDVLQNFSKPLSIVSFGLGGFAAIALLAATIGIVNTLLMSVLERTQEIGLLKALGMRRRGITYIYLVEAASIGFWGGVFGVVLAVIAGFVANPILARTLFQGSGGAVSILTYPLPYMLAIIIGAMLIGLLAGTLPAIRAGRLDPIDALRRE